MARPTRSTPAKPAKASKPATLKRSFQDDFFPPESAEDDFWPLPTAEPTPTSSSTLPPNAPLVAPTSPDATSGPPLAGLLLDHFAGQALAGILAGTLAVPNSALVVTDVATLAYRCAQAMLTERTKYLDPPEDVPF